MPTKTVRPHRSRRSFLKAAAALWLAAASPAAADTVVVVPDQGVPADTAGEIERQALAYAQAQAALSDLADRAERCKYRHDEARSRADAAQAQVMECSREVSALEGELRDALSALEDALRLSFAEGLADPLDAALSSADPLDALCGLAPQGLPEARRARDARDALALRRQQADRLRSDHESACALAAALARELGDAVDEMERQALRAAEALAGLEERARREQAAAEEVRRSVEQAAAQQGYAARDASAMAPSLFDDDFEPYAGYVYVRGVAGPLADAVVEAALSQLGAPYVWGGSDPSGFDCSGLVWWSYARCGIDIPRTTYSLIEALKAQGRWTDDLSALAAGDLVFPSEGHVGLYLGDGLMVHAPKPGDRVRVAEVYSFIGGGRPA